MVDINLFDDEPEEQENEQENQSFDDLGDSGDLDLGDDISEDSLEGEDDFGGGFGDDNLDGESLDDALGFDDELPADDDLDSETLMADDLSDLDEGDADLEEDYDFGGGSRQRVSPLLWVIMLLVVAFVAIYFFKPELLSFSKSKRRKPVKVTQTAGKQVKKQVSSDSQTASASTAAKQQAPVGTAASDSGAVSTARPQMQGTNPGSVRIAASVQIFNEFAMKNQFAMLVVDKDRVTAEYASATKGMSDTFGKQLQTLSKAESYTASPEDMHTVNGQSVYFGVISCKLNPGKVQTGMTGTPFANEDAFINAVKSKLQLQGLPQTGQKKRTGSKNVFFEWTVEGDKAKVMAFLQSLTTLPGAWEPVKILISPSELNDFQAKRVKLVLDLAATIGNTTAPLSSTAM